MHCIGVYRTKYYESIGEFCIISTANSYQGHILYHPRTSLLNVYSKRAEVVQTRACLRTENCSRAII